MTAVELKHITKIFPPKTVAVNDVSLKIRDGEFFVLLGPSGCGKTTTLRIVAGLEKPTKGKVYIGDRDVTDLPPRKRDVAMVFQTYALYPHMKVYDNIAFPLKVRKMPKDEIDKRVREIAGLLGIEELLDRYPKQLSGGQQQRVALARALVRHPKVWLMDEPLSNLDALLRIRMRAEIKRIQKELKITTIYVTHDQVEAMSMADRIAVMNKGRVLQVGSPREIYHKPKTLFVAGFIGTPPMNFINVVFGLEKDRYVLQGKAFKIILPNEMGRIIEKQLGVDKEVVLGIRPEHIGIVEDRGRRENNIVEAEVYIVEPLGTETIINVKLDDTIVKVKTIKEIIFEPGSKIKLYIDPQRIYVFDPATEKVLV